MESKIEILNRQKGLINMGIDSIEKSDLIIIDNIAKKYKLTLQELGKIISKNTEKRLRLQVLLSLEELYYLDKMAKLKGVSRGQYCYACCQEAINKIGRAHV